MTGIIFNIQRFCLHDGPGIRTTVFMKGCPLRCLWCHNPEGLNQKIQLQYFKDKCIGCGRCRNECECHVFTEQSHQVLFDQCTLCEKCVAKCPSEAISICGQKMTPDELLVKILSDKDFYGTDGGVTFSGGEPLLQADFIVEAARAAKKNGLTVAVDTCGYVPWQSIEKVLDVSDIFLYDIKAFSDDIHKKATGVSNKQILLNLQKLDALKKEIWVRIPVIPGINAFAEEMEKIAEYISVIHNIRHVTLMPYHSLGNSKYATLGYHYPFDSSLLVDDSTMNHFKQIFVSRKLLVK